MKYLVMGSEGPDFAASEEGFALLEKIILPSFEVLTKLEAEKKILAGGVPVGERALIFVVEAGSHGELDDILRDLPVWGMLDWEVVPLQSFQERAKKERSVYEDLKKKLG